MNLDHYSRAGIKFDGNYSLHYKRNMIYMKDSLWWINKMDSTSSDGYLISMFNVYLNHIS